MSRFMEGRGVQPFLTSYVQAMRVYPPSLPEMQLK